MLRKAIYKKTSRQSSTKLGEHISVPVCVCVQCAKRKRIRFASPYASIVNEYIYAMIDD